MISLRKICLVATILVCAILFLGTPHVASAVCGGDLCDVQHAAGKVGDFLSSAAGSIAQGTWCQDTNKAIGAALLDCGTQNGVSFMGFQGSLQPPSAEGLDETLTKAKTAREFIVNTVNFALSFLGVIAMVIVIYGGFLYITAAGNEEQSTKGKKALTYAVIGILIIIASFALVNTLLRFGGGTGSDRTGINVTAGVRGVGEQGTNVGQKNIYSLGALQINSALNDFIDAYKKLAVVANLLAQAKNLPRPSKSSDNKNYVVQAASVVSEIKNSVSPLSQTYAAANILLQGWISQTENQDLTTKEFDGGVIKDQFEKKLDESTVAEGSKKDFNSAIDELIGADAPGPAAPKGKLVIVQNIMGPIANSSANGAVQNALQRGLINPEDISRAFAGIDPNTTVSQIFQSVFSDLKVARNLGQDPSKVELLVQAIKSLQRLYLVVKDIQFVYVKINASEVTGSAPLVIEFNGLESRDPVAQTIPDENYKWDPDGDGENGIKSGGGFAPVECKTETFTGPTATCTYNKPGTYVVRLSIPSKDPLHIASGEALLPIQVLPSIARISLKAEVGALTQDVRKYEKDSKGQWQMTVDKNEVDLTTQEAQQTGVTFNAESSVSGTGEALKFFSWSFGDGTQPEQGATKSKVEAHKYTREGKYPLTLEVTDTGNRKDRKIANVVIASIAARIGVTKTISEPDVLLEFDGSISKSDQGTINSYKWTVSGKDDQDITNSPDDVAVVGDPSASTLRLKFKKPGSYAVKLSVSDGSKTADSSVPISIRSRRPHANFDIKSCTTVCPDPTKPSVAEFDAGSSFDPDQGDMLTYEWSFFNEAGDKLEAGPGFSILNNVPLAGQNAKKVRVQFSAIGKYKAVLNVNDSHADQSIRQEDSKEKKFEIASLVETAWDPATKTADQMKNGKASFTFKGTAKNATRANIDFGDSETGEQSIEVKNGAGAFSFDHDYTKAGSYLVSLTVESEDGKGKNKLTKRVYVAAAENPIAAMEVSIDGVPVVLNNPTTDNPKPALEVIRTKQLIQFDGSHSLNSAGAEDGLSYSWNFGEGSPRTGARVEHSYHDLSPADAPYTVTLTVAEKNNPTKTDKVEFYVKVVSKKPIANTLSLEKKTSGNRTPIDVILTAEGATDPDGSITNYEFWYYDPAEKDKKLSVVDTQSNTATLTVETAGEENEEHQYTFCVQLTDNENSVSTCDDLFDENELPTLSVKNGPNKPPVASFATDRTQVKVNEPITFTSSSTDPDGRIASYTWDFDGDGFQNDNSTQSGAVTHSYTKKSPSGGYRVKLKVVDDKGAAGYSKEAPVFVDTISTPPQADFLYQVQTTPARRVKFFDRSRADATHGAKLAKWYWDFDTMKEFGCDKQPKPTSCNGDPTDDIDGTDQNPVFDYPASGSYQVRLTVEDSDGNISEPKTFLINLISGLSGGTGTGTLNAQILKAELKACGTDCPDPAFKFEDSQGQKRKTMHIPPNSNGANVSLFWGESTGDILSYKVDKNIWCDSDGDGNRSNDADNPDVKKGTCTIAANGVQADHCWTTNYQRYAKTGSPKGPGRFTTLLTVTDRTGKTANDTLDVVFDGTTDPALVMGQNDCNGKPNTLGASILSNLGTQNIILLGLLSGVIVVLIGFGVTSLLSRGKERNI